MSEYRGISSPEFNGLISKVRLEAVFRRLVFERDNQICALCKTPVVFADMDVDHIIPKSRGGSDDASNMQCTHWICNSRKGVSDTVSTDPSNLKPRLKRSRKVNRKLPQTRGLSVGEAAILKCVTRATIYKAISEGTIGVVGMDGNKLVLKSADVESLQPRRQMGVREYSNAQIKIISPNGAEAARKIREKYASWDEPISTW